MQGLRRHQPLTGQHLLHLRFSTRGRPSPQESSRTGGVRRVGVPDIDRLMPARRTGLLLRQGGGRSRPGSRSRWPAWAGIGRSGGAVVQSACRISARERLVGAFRLPINGGALLDERAAWRCLTRREEAEVSSTGRGSRWRGARRRPPRGPRCQLVLIGESVSETTLQSWALPSGQIRQELAPFTLGK